MLSLKIVLLFLCIWTVSTKRKTYDPKTLNEEKANQVFTCLNKVFCDERKPEEFFGILYAINDSVQVTEDMLQLLSKSYSVHVTTIEEDWLPVPDYYCPMSFPEKTSRYADVMTGFAKYYKKYDCELKNENEYCIKLDILISGGEALIQKYEDLNICYNPKKMVPFG